jgi:molybdopterin-containing oxidoreductase family iron-sulfur binding subunit
MLEANNSSFGIRKLPFYDFSKAKIIVSFGYDFLGSSFNNNLFNKQFAKSRRVSRNQKKMSRLYSFESNLTITGANADHRIPIKSLESPIYITKLYNVLFSGWGAYGLSGDISSDAIDNDGDGLIDSEDDNEFGDPREFATAVAVTKIAEDVLNEIMTSW